MREEKGRMGSTHEQRGQAHRQAILVLGMHRSGTSSMAGVLSLLGAEAPKTLIQGDTWNPRGYWESDKLGRFHDRILTSAGSAWGDWSEFDPMWIVSRAAQDFHGELRGLIEGEFGDTHLFVVKDPRICRFLPFWLRGLESLHIAPKIVFPLRNPLEVAQSLERRDGITITEGLLLWLRHCLDAEAATRGLPRSFQRYEALIGDWRGVARRIGDDLSIAWPAWSPESEAKIDAFLTRELRHNVASRDELSLREDVFAWVKGTYECLLALAEGGGDARAKKIFAKLDDIHRAFNEASGVFGALVARHRDTAQQAKGEAAGLKKQLDTERESVRQAEEAAKASGIELEASRKLVGDLREALARSEAALAEARRHEEAQRKDVAAGAREIGALQERLSRLDTDLAGAKRQEESRRADLSARNANVRRLEAEAAETKAALEAERTARAAAEAEVARLVEAYREFDDPAVRNLARVVRRSARLGRRMKELATLDGALPGRRRQRRQKLRLARDAELIAGSGLFDPEWYLRTYPDVAAAGEDPLIHYLQHGVAERRNPNPLFDTDWYLRQYPDVAATGFNPLVHYVARGAAEKRDPGPGFSTGWYLDRNPDVAEAGVDPFWHFLRQGRTEGRRGTASGPFAEENAVAEVKAIAFYLPQFHPIPENDEWWGKDFTEWINVVRAKPEFEGHDQPRLPGELGYYDLRSVAVQRRQVALAKEYGIGGFCFYFYWFGGKRILEQPVIQYLQNPDLDLPFCLCWANENWTRTWDGLEREVLIEQDYSPEDDTNFISYLSSYLKDPRYLRVEGKPLVIVYRPNLLPDPRATVVRWRDWCRENGIGEIYLATTQSFEAVDPGIYGFDAAIEFPPNNSAPPEITGSVAPYCRDAFEGHVYDWRIFPARSRNYVDPGYMIFRGVNCGWDNFARRPGRGTAFAHFTIEGYREWLTNAGRDTVSRIREPSAQLVFINAWNEWAEGAYLEPDRSHGYRKLEATRAALMDVNERTPGGDVGKVAARTSAQKRKIVIVTHDAYQHGAQFLALNLTRIYANVFGMDVAVVFLDEGPLKDEFAKWAVCHDLAGRDPDSDEARLLACRLRAEGYIAAICNTTVSGAFVPALKAANITVVSLVHELPGVIDQFGLFDSARVISQLADKVVFPARHVAEAFERIASIPERRQIIRAQGLYKRNGIAPDRTERARRTLRKRLGLQDERKIVLAVGYADRRKAPDIFVEAGIEVLTRGVDATFIWLGDGAAEVLAGARAMVEKAGVGDRFLFPGLETATDVFYAGADVYAMTSREDPFPSVILEAMDAGLPVVGFEGAGGFCDLVLEASGVLVPAFDTKAFGAALSDLLMDEGRRRAVGEVGRRLIASRYSFDEYARDLLSFAGLLKRVSVIVPNYNYARYIEARLASVASQTIQPYELIVLDDASTDDSVARIRRFLAGTSIPSHLVVNEENSGSVFRQWQRGVEMARGDYVWIAEADDLADPEFLETLLPSFERPDVVMSYCQSRQMDSDGNVLCEHYLDYVADIDAERWTKPYVADGREEIARALFLKNTIPNVSGVIFRREPLHKTLVAHADEIMSFRNAGDWVAYLRLLENGAVAFSPRSLNSHRRHQSSVTVGNFDVRQLQEIVRVQRETIRRYKLGQDAIARADRYSQDLYERFGLKSGRYPYFEALIGHGEIRVLDQ